MDESTQILKTQIDSLSASLRQYLNDGNWSKEISQIARTFGLQEYQITSIKNEILFVIIGLNPYLDLQKNIATETGMSPDTVQKIVLQISEQILDKIEVPERANAMYQPPKPERQSNVGS